MNYKKVKMRKIIVLLLLVSSTVFAQKTTVVSGSLESLKGIKEFNLVFDNVFPNVNSFTEEGYLDAVTKKNPKEATRVGSGDGSIAGERFKKEWYSDKKNRYAAKFIESFNKRFDGEVKVGENVTSAKYTITLKTTYIHPGCITANDHDSSRMNGFITITETANPGNVLLVYNFEMMKEKNMSTEGYIGNFDPTSGGRISETYAKFAKEFAADLKKFTK
jgi:hypothetical protein